jgi:putative transposase
MLIRKAYKFRLYPTPEQTKRLAVQFGHARFVYNHFLHERQEKYAETGEGLNYQSTARELTQMKRSEDYSWLREADSQVLQQSLMDLEKGYHNFFAKRTRYPKYKSRKSKESIRYPQRVKVSIEEKRTSLPKVGWVKTVYHRAIQGEIKNVTVSRTKSGRYFASFQVEMEKCEPEYDGKPNGIDLGLREVVVLADGRKVSAPRYLISAEKKLRRLMQGLSRKAREAGEGKDSGNGWPGCTKK